jgi:hypothetical protein
MESKKGTAQRRRVERGIYRQPNGKYAVCFMLAGKPRFRTVAGDLDAARRQRELLVAAPKPLPWPWPRGCGSRPWPTAGLRASKRRSPPVSGASARSRRTATTSRKRLLPTLAPRLMHTIGVDDVAALFTGL